MNANQIRMLIRSFYFFLFLFSLLKCQFHPNKSFNLDWKRTKKNAVCNFLRLSFFSSLFFSSFLLIRLVIALQISLCACICKLIYQSKTKQKEQQQQKKTLDVAENSSFFLILFIHFIVVFRRYFIRYSVLNSDSVLKWQFWILSISAWLGIWEQMKRKKTR